MTDLNREEHPPIPPGSEMFVFSRCAEDITPKWFFRLPQDASDIERLVPITDIAWRKIIAAVAEVEWRKIADEEDKDLDDAMESENSHDYAEATFGGMTARSNVDAWREWGSK